MRRHKPKASSQISHAQRRISQRFNIELSKKEYKEACTQIRCGRAEFVERQSNRVTVFKLQIQGRYMLAVYDSLRKTIATFLPLHYIEGSQPHTTGCDEPGKDV